MQLIILFYNILNVVKPLHKKKIEKRKKITAVVFSLILLFLFSFKSNTITTEGIKVDDNNKLKSSAITLPIYIDDLGFGDYTWEEAASEDWCSGSGTNVDPYLLENLIIDGLGGFCIRIDNSKAYFTLRNCTLYNGYSGLDLNNVTNGNIIENNCSNNNFWGIDFWACYNSSFSSNIINSIITGGGICGEDSNNNMISNNSVFDMDYGILIEVGSLNEISGNNIYDIKDDFGILLLGASNNSVEGNEIDNCYRGIGLYSSDDNDILRNTVTRTTGGYSIFVGGSDFNHITENIINNNSAYGIHLIGCENNDLTENTVFNNTLNGFYLWDSHFNTILENDIYDNTENGIIFEDSRFNNISGNVIHDNTMNGAELDMPSENNLFYENFFHRNGKHAVDNGANNDWNNTMIGNYWDNYTGTDTSPKDGIGDVPHNFGTGIDYLPIVDDASPVITINSPNPGDAFDDAPNFDLSIDEDYLWDMWYTLDGGVDKYFTEFSGIIDQAAWDAFSDGNITLTFYANDKAENTGSAEVIVSKDTQAPVIVINKPIADKKISSAFRFELNVTDPHLDTIWYSLDGGVTNFTAATPSEKIEKAAWKAVAKGDITITFYANDTLGHLASESVTIKKVSPAAIGLDYGTTSILIALISGVAIIAIITKIRSKKQIISY